MVAVTTDYDDVHNSHKSRNIRCTLHVGQKQGMGLGEKIALVAFHEFEL